MRTRVDQSTFQAGEVDPLAAARFDSKSYYQGAQTLENAFPLATGGVRRRPGTRHIAFLSLTDAAAEIEFIFNDDQAYNFIFQTGRVDIYTSDGTFCMSLTAQPWTLAMVGKMGFAQRGDTLVLVHKDLPPRIIKRTGATTFTSSLYTFDPENVATAARTLQPYYKFAPSTEKLTPSGTTGAITITRDLPAGWTANHINTLVRYKKKELLITGLVDVQTVNATVIQTLPGTTADTDWDEQVFSPAHGYPRSVAFHEDRLWFGGSRDYPPGFWASKIGLYFNFDQGTALDNESIWAAIGAEQVAEVRNMVSFRNLLLFTDVGEFYIPTTTNKPITPTTVSVRKQSPYGSASVRPRPFDGAVAFVQKTGSAVREMTFSELEQAYNAFSVSTLASHLIKTPSALAVLSGTSTRPEQLLFGVMSDGTLGVLHSNRAEQFTGWSRWTTNGKFKAVSVVLDQVFVVVERTIGGVLKWALEVFDPSCYLDCSKRVASGGAATKNFAGFGHLANEASAWAVSFDYSLGPQAVDGAGNVVASAPVTQVDVGYNFVPKIVPMPLQVQASNGYVSGRPKRAVKCTLIVDNTRSCAVNGTDFLFRAAGDDFSAAAPLRSGRFDFRLLGWDKLGQPVVTQPEPGPFTLLGFELEVAIG